MLIDVQKPFGGTPSKHIHGIIVSFRKKEASMNRSMAWDMVSYGSTAVCCQETAATNIFWVDNRSSLQYIYFQRLELVHVDLAPGDCVIFHGNTLHQSTANTSEFKRWNLIFSYNTKSNSPDRPHYNAQYNPLKRWSADSVEKCLDLRIEQRNQWVDPFKNPNITIIQKDAR